MIKKIAAVAAFAICLNWVGIAKAEVTSECSLSGNGDFLCTFNNKGKKKDNVCIRLVLAAKNQSDTKFTFAGDVAASRDDHLQKSREYLEKGMSAEFDLTYAKILAANVESIEEETPRVSNFYLTNIKRIAKKSGMPLDNYINKNLSTLTALILATEGKGISNEICSGIVDANDLRERHGLAKFSGIYLLREEDLSKYNKEDLSLKELELANRLNGKVRGIENASPVDACLSRDAPWDSVCSFSINTTADMRSYLKKAILSAPDTLPTPTPKAPEDE